MSESQTHAVTGAYGYSGKYIASKLLGKGHTVITLTNSLQRANPFGQKIRAFPFNFANPTKLIDSLRGVSVLYNTYWVRFNHKMFRHEDAVKNTQVLFDAARAAGVQRIVHISITNPSETSPLEYFSGKARLENALINSGLSYSILRPTVLFGKEDILINNIAWLLRKLPFFGMFGDGKYRLQPIYVDDLAGMAVDEGENDENGIVNAIGPETFTYKSLVETVGEIIGEKKPILAIHPSIGYLAGNLIGKLVGDVVITRAEIEGLIADLLYVDSPQTGVTKLTQWAREHAGSLGRTYTSELRRRKNRAAEYNSN
ncbi:MAG: NAD(P)H-binding protein [Anaerolineales bacterium]|nr:NAD(P)H-binding protein [Anaerolineales bacterium]